MTCPNLQDQELVGLLADLTAAREEYRALGQGGHQGLGGFLLARANRLGAIVDSFLAPKPQPQEAQGQELGQGQGQGPQGVKL